MQQVEEFCKDRDVSSLTPNGEYGLLVVWQWIDAVEDDDGQCSGSQDLHQDGSLSTDSDIEEEEPTMTTATFKCIGVTRSPSYQEALKKANKMILEGNTVAVRVVPDSRAISFPCQLDQKWHIIGYVVREVCDCVHDTISSKSIISTKFAWVKFKVVRTTGPGYYAAIRITRRGIWPPTVHQSASTMF